MCAADFGCEFGCRAGAGAIKIIKADQINTELRSVFVRCFPVKNFGCRVPGARRMDLKKLIGLISLIELTGLIELLGLMDR